MTYVYRSVFVSICISVCMYSICISVHIRFYVLNISVSMYMFVCISISFYLSVRVCTVQQSQFMNLTLKKLEIIETLLMVL